MGVGREHHERCSCTPIRVLIYVTNLMPHFIIFEISTALNNDFQADCSDVFRFLIELSIPKL